jgi:hypothetical protein
MKKLFIALAAAALTTTALADTVAFNLSLTPDVALADRSDRIEGLTLSIWGENNQEAISLGFVNGSVGDSTVFNWGLLNYADNFTGVQWGVLNTAKEDYLGWQHGLANHVGGDLTGLQTGWFNCANHLSGLQVGLINYAKTASGLQVGVLNLIEQNDMWIVDLPEQLAPAFIFVNWRF